MNINVECVNRSDKFDNGCRALTQKTNAGCSKKCPFYKTAETYEAEREKCNRRNYELGYPIRP